MYKPILLNDLLHLSQEDIARAKIRFNQYNGVAHPKDVYLVDPNIVNTKLLFWRTKNRFFSKGDIAICLIEMSKNIWLLTTIKEVTRELNITGEVNYDGEEMLEYQPFFGRVLLKYRKGQAQLNLATKILHELEVLQILPTIYDGDDFPGYDKVRLSYTQLAAIVHKNKKDWVAALGNQKAVYLITDTVSGALYVGSATGEKGMFLLQRWQSYVENGHGGNRRLQKVVAEKGFDYIKNHYQYSILENYNARIDNSIVQARETWWKVTLGSRAYGLNAN